MGQDDNAQDDKPAPAPITMNPLERPFNDRPLGHVTRVNEGQYDKRIELNNPPPPPCGPAKDDD